MPGFDRSGPRGAGPMTGGARGWCSPSDNRYASGHGFGRKMAYDRGFRKGFFSGSAAGNGFGGENSFNKAAEVNMLREYATDLKASLAKMEHCIAALEKESVDTGSA